MDHLDPITVLSRYPSIQPVTRIETLGGAGGFSGARLWRVVARETTFCLRCWPPSYPDEERLLQIHGVLRSVFDRGVREVPVPLAAEAGATFVRHDGALWELTPWMPGKADYHHEPRREKLRAAMQWLARFHLAAAPAMPDVRRSPGIAQRLELLHQLRRAECDEIERRLGAVGCPEFVSRAWRVLGAFRTCAARADAKLRDVLNVAAPLQPCIRDIWRDHVLFEGDRVSGVVDFGALRSECVSADVARLLGSLVQNDRAGWKAGVATYDQIRPLSEGERRLVTAFDESGVLLSGMNWLRWICLERRKFEQPERILHRLDEILARLDRPRGLVVE